MPQIWLVFLASAAVIVVAGTKLSFYGDRIADLTGLGRLRIGVVLMAVATSLPEVFTTISAGYFGAPDPAARDRQVRGAAGDFGERCGSSFLGGRSECDACAGAE